MFPEEVPRREFIPIEEKDLNLASAEHKKGVAHTIFAAMSYNAQVLSHPTMFGFGSSYQFGHDNTALDMWSIWASVSFGF